MGQIERKAELEALIGGAAGAIQFSQHIEGGGAAFYAQADRMGFEGMVSKRADAPYRSDRTTSWLKIKCYEETDYEVAGVLREPGKPLVAYMVTPDKERRYVGGAFITLNEKMRERLWARVQAKAPAAEGRQGEAGDRMAEARPGRQGAAPEGRAAAAACDAAGDQVAMKERIGQSRDRQDRPRHRSRRRIGALLSVPLRPGRDMRDLGQVIHSDIV